MGAHNVSAVLEDLSNLIKDIPTSKQGCQPVSDDVKADLALLDDVKSVEDLMKHIQDNFKGDQKDNIMTEFEAAFQALAVDDTQGFGTNLGSALHHMIVGKYPDETLV